MPSLRWLNSLRAALRLIWADAESSMRTGQAHRVHVLGSVQPSLMDGHLPEPKERRQCASSIM